jgi:hypothetical protein
MKARSTQLLAILNLNELTFVCVKRRMKQSEKQQETELEDYRELTRVEN